jgi:hypothetical protein
LPSKAFWQAAISPCSALAFIPSSNPPMSGRPFLKPALLKRCVPSLESARTSRLERIFHMLTNAGEFAGE